MTHKEFVDQFRAYNKKAHELIPGQMKEQLSERELNRTDSSSFSLNSIHESGMTYSAEYNDSCHCHPEYQRVYITIPWELL